MDAHISLKNDADFSAQLYPHVLVVCFPDRLTTTHVVNRGEAAVCEAIDRAETWELSRPVDWNITARF